MFGRFTPDMVFGFFVSMRSDIIQTLMTGDLIMAAKKKAKKKVAKKKGKKKAKK